MDAAITRFTLSNGLLVVLKEVHTAPLVSHWIWYRVGSRDEVPGGTGLSHWVEHMQFKGTPRYPTGVLDKAISRNGGVWNAFTYLDWTAYFETLPANQIGLAMQIEADRITESLFDLNEFEAERAVIISEREGNENEPTFRLAEEVQAAAFRVHAYHHETIGDMADLETNAVVTIAGDFETAAMIQDVREYYEPIPSGSHVLRRVRPEPDQTGQRSIQVEGPGETVYLEAAYHIPPAEHADFLALNVMDSLLSGPSDLSIFGGGLSNKTSRLYQALVENELAVSVFGGMQATIDPYLYNLSIVLQPESSPEAVMAALDQEISRLQETLPTVEELERAVKQARALFAYGTESITNQAAWLGFVEMFADQTWLSGYLDQLSMVSPQDVQRVAQTYLRQQNRVLGTYIPTGVQA
jgi:zinc protease